MSGREPGPGRVSIKKTREGEDEGEDVEDEDVAPTNRNRVVEIRIFLDLESGLIL